MRQWASVCFRTNSVCFRTKADGLPLRSTLTITVRRASSSTWTSQSRCLQTPRHVSPLSCSSSRTDMLTYEFDLGWGEIRGGIRSPDHPACAFQDRKDRKDRHPQNEKIEKIAQIGPPDRTDRTDRPAADRHIRARSAIYQIVDREKNNNCFRLRQFIAVYNSNTDQ